MVPSPPFHQNWARGAIFFFQFLLWESNPVLGGKSHKMWDPLSTTWSPGVVIFQAHSHWPSSKSPNSSEVSYPSAGSQGGFWFAKMWVTHLSKLTGRGLLCILSSLRDFQRAADFLVCSGFHLLGWSGKHPNFSYVQPQDNVIFSRQNQDRVKRVWT